MVVGLIIIDSLNGRVVSTTVDIATTKQDVRTVLQAVLEYRLLCILVAFFGLSLKRTSKDIRLMIIMFVEVVVVFVDF